MAIIFGDFHNNFMDMETKPHENPVKISPWKDHENSILSILKNQGCFIVMKNLLIVWHGKKKHEF